MKKANITVLASLLTMVLVAMATGAGTMAYFTDIETSSGNTFTAGTMDLAYRIDLDGDGDWDTNWKNGEDAQFSIGPIKPTDEGYVVFEIKNIGNIGGYLTVKRIHFTEDAGSLTEPESINDPDNYGNLDEFGCVLIWFDSNNNGDVDDGEFVVMSDETPEPYEAGEMEGLPYYVGPEDDIHEPVPIMVGFHYAEIGPIDEGELGPIETEIYLGGGESTYMRIYWTIAYSGGDWLNVIQDDSVSLDFEWELKQALEP